MVPIKEIYNLIKTVEETKLIINKEENLNLISKETIEKSNLQYISPHQTSISCNQTSQKNWFEHVMPILCSKSKTCKIQIFFNKIS